jgi:hypothetical protein
MSKLLHFLRDREQTRLKAEAAGESFWTSSFSPEVRARILHLHRRLCEDHADPGNFHKALLAEARKEMLGQLGKWQLAGQDDAPNDMFVFMNRNGGDALVPSAIEALYHAFAKTDEYERQSGFYGWTNRPGRFQQGINDVFRQERVAWSLVDGEMVSFASQELQAAVVEPVLKLLHNRAFADADAAYRKSLQELSEGHPDDAITDAGTALQTALRALGCTGDSIGPLLASARKKGLLAAHDNALGRAVEDIINWVGADRSQMGDSHAVTKASDADGWFSVHIVGALIVRLCSGARGPQERGRP